MEPKFQSSFIPKKPIIAGAVSPVSVVQPTSLFSVIATVLFIVAVLVSGGLYVYKGVLNNQIAESDKSLADARAAFQPEKIQELIDANTRIMAAKSLLDKHVAVSPILTLLQDITVKKMRLTSFKYSAPKDALPSVIMEGESATYNALADEQTLFAQNQFIKNPQFSDFNLNENGNVTFTFSAMVDSNLVSYKKAVGQTSP